MFDLDFSKRRVLVVGDFMVDRYVHGSVDRISPEAPVPVLLHRFERLVPGGAANVAVNLATLGATVDCAGVTGMDEAGRLLGDAFCVYPAIQARDLVQDESRPTTCKVRIMSGRQQLMRIDSESSLDVDPAIEEMILDAIERLVPSADIVVICDYAKGVCTGNIVRRVIGAATGLGKIVIADPKRPDLSFYRGATILTPNRRELTDATRLPCGTDAEAGEAAAAAIAQTGSGILLTRSEQGMSYFEAGQRPVHLATEAREVFDVSGAGDTVVAATALGLASGLPMVDVMRLANAAAGIVVGRAGTASVSTRELADALRRQQGVARTPRGALVSQADAARQAEEWRAAGLTTGFTNGCFDLLHSGHISLLIQAAGACDRLIVALNSDASVKRLKGPDRPVQDERTRALVLGAIEAVDLVVIFGEDTPAGIIGAIQPDVLVKGADYTVHQIAGADMVQARGGKVVLVPLVEGQSTTSLIQRSGRTPARESV